MFGFLLNERLAEYGWKPHQMFVAQKCLSRASIYWYMHETKEGTVSSNSRFQTVSFQQYSANLSLKVSHRLTGKRSKLLTWVLQESRTMATLWLLIHELMKSIITSLIILSHSHANIYIYIYVCTYIYIYIGIYIYIYMCVYIYIYIYMYVCVHIYIYIYSC